MTEQKTGRHVTPYHHLRFRGARLEELHLITHFANGEIVGETEEWREVVSVPADAPTQHSGPGMPAPVSSFWEDGE